MVHKFSGGTLSPHPQPSPGPNPDMLHLHLIKLRELSLRPALPPRQHLRPHCHPPPSNHTPCSHFPHCSPKRKENSNLFRIKSPQGPSRRLSPRQPGPSTGCTVQAQVHRRVGAELDQLNLFYLDPRRPFHKKHVCTQAHTSLVFEIGTR